MLTIKNRNIFAIIITILAGITILLVNSLFILDQRKLALVLQFGDVKAIYSSPGLHARMPVIQEVIFFDKRIQNINFHSDDANEVVTADQKTMRLDAFAKYRIVDPLKFYRAVVNESAFNTRLLSILESSIRKIVGISQFSEFLDENTADLMNQIAESVRSQMKEFGVYIVDVRIVRLGLPESARIAVYERMKTDRAKEAAEIRAKGLEEAKIIRAEASRKKDIILAEGERQAQILRGEGEAMAAEILIKAAQKDIEFYKYYRSLQSYKEALSPETSTFILSQKDNRFFEYSINNKK